MEIEKSVTIDADTIASLVEAYIREQTGERAIITRSDVFIKRVNDEQYASIKEMFVRWR